MTGAADRVRALAARRRPVTRAELSRFAAALRGRRRASAVRALVDGAFVVSILERRGLRPLLRDRSDLPLADPADARDVAEAVDAGLGALPVKATCLRRSVVLLRELHRQDRTATLHIGVRRGPDGIEAHAWLQAGGEVVNDDRGTVATYTELSAGEAQQLMPRLT